jgi:hypothetical protein
VLLTVGALCGKIHYCHTNDRGIKNGMVFDWIGCCSTTIYLGFAWVRVWTNEPLWKQTGVGVR